MVKGSDSIMWPIRQTSFPIFDLCARDSGLNGLSARRSLRFVHPSRDRKSPTSGATSRSVQKFRRSPDFTGLIQTGTRVFDYLRPFLSFLLYIGSELFRSTADGLGTLNS